MGPRKGLNRANSMLCAECVLPSGGLEIGCLPVGGAHVSGPQCPLGAGSLESISLVVSAVLGESAREGVYWKLLHVFFPLLILWCILSLPPVTWRV